MEPGDGATGQLTSTTNVHRTGLGETVDIEISVILAMKYENHHKILARNPSFFVELSIGEEKQCTNAVQIKGGRVVWDKGMMLTINASSNLIIRMYCKHRHVRDDHVVAEASYEVLELERNTDIALDLYDPKSSAQNRTVVASVTLRLKVALSVTFKIGENTEMDFRSLTCLKHMEAIVGTISPEKFKQLRPAWVRLFSSLETFSSLAQKVAELDSRAQVAVGAMASAIKVLVDQIKRDERIEALGRIMCELYEYVVDACTVRKIASFEKTLQRLLAQTAECAYFISDYQRITMFAQRAVVNMISNADEMISNFEAAFGELKIALILGSSLQTTLVSYRILQIVERIENLIRIDRLPILENVGWDSAKTCLRGTREATIRSIVQWSSQRGDNAFTNNICLLSGPASCGKSTIVHSIAKLFHEQNRLGVAVFLHDEVLDVSSRKISSSIVHQLAGYDSTIQARIADKIKADQSLVWADIERQFRVLVVDTASSADSKLLLIGPILIIIDNLHLISDEERYKVLTTISDHSKTLPPNFRFLLTCRDDDDVAWRILRNVSRTQRVGYDDSDNGSNGELSQYIADFLTDLFSKRPLLSEHYNSLQLQGVFEARARGMHFWVSLVYRSVLACNEVDIIEFLSLLLSAPSPLSNNEAMDQLYHAIFKVFFRLELGAQHLFDVMIQSPKPLPLSYLRRMACIPWDPTNKVNIVDTTKALGLIIEIDRPEKGESLYGIHPSLEDFLTNPRRCETTGVYVDRNVPIDHSAAEVCIRIMNQSLRYNICRLDDDMTTNAEIRDNNQLIEQHLSRSLRYACFNWILHLENEDQELNDTLRLKLRTFTSSHILHWIEAMSILGHVEDIDSKLNKFLRWLQARDIKTGDDLYVVTAYALCFVRKFSAIISKGPLQIYISALPLMPQVSGLSLLRQDVSYLLPSRTIYHNELIEPSWTATSTTELEFSDDSCSFNHGTFIALGSRSGLVWVINCRTNYTMEWQINVNKGVQALTISPDRKQLGAVMETGQFSVHNFENGERIFYAETGVKNPFILYSNDCKSILIIDYCSGTSRTSDYHLWDALTGSLIVSGKILLHDPLGFALSPNGHRIAVPDEVGVKVIDLLTNKEVTDVSTGPRKRMSEKNCILAWAPDRSTLAIARGAESILYLWNMHDGGTGWACTIDAMRGPISSHSLHFTADSSLLILCLSCPRTQEREAMIILHTWDTRTGLLIRKQTILQGKKIALSRNLYIFPDGQEISLLSNSYSRDNHNGWDISMTLFADNTPAYMTHPPIFNDQKMVPKIFHVLSGREPSSTYASKVDEDGCIVNSTGKPFVFAPYPNYDISTSHLSSTYTQLEIKHPEAKLVVFKYVLEWGSKG
ncbi:hypothetical protein JR316_0010061 [Psilocybe cubensis]|uniref:AAA+ ATPase domain-containing protein n=2 Tax=Psilocybe cubensis TaxID=181762 RepID=A0A8H7XN60_PSICU|nr:hypothetical protein JR316_0010061 [Psilocybe cubensis]KAH9477829.1 hypothetical protein JR316_0010061 [Psilocybe cubensis]